MNSITHNTIVLGECGPKLLTYSCGLVPHICMKLQTDEFTFYSSVKHQQLLPSLIIL